jgi:hypothetical protein
VPKDKTVVLGLVTTKKGMLVIVDVAGEVWG